MTKTIMLAVWLSGLQENYLFKGLQMKVLIVKLLFLFLTQNICCVYSKNRLNETVLLSTQNTSLKWVRK